MLYDNLYQQIVLTNLTRNGNYRQDIHEGHILSIPLFTYAFLGKTKNWRLNKLHVDNNIDNVVAITLASVKCCKIMLITG